jgi:23S rRNA (cytidine1920-2'-O)/16S rRNA (cytidine1409-2'-O)-methyltransferase
VAAVGSRRAGGKDRLDRLLVDRGLAPSRERAQALVMAGRVRVGGHPAAKPGQRIAIDAALEVAGPDHPFVGRGGLKLAGALDRFGIEVAGIVALDIGASTGGFTDCLLQRGAARVYALDVGSGQIDWSIRRDPRVVVMEGINARYLAPVALPEPPGLVTVDVSFISLRLILPVLPPILAPAAEVLALVKPQFEVGRDQVGPGGIVRDPALHRAALAAVAATAGACGFTVRGGCPSPIRGAEGNREFFLRLRPGAPAPDAGVEELLGGMVDEG